MCPGRLLFDRDRFVGKKGMEGAGRSTQERRGTGKRERKYAVRRAQYAEKTETGRKVSNPVEDSTGNTQAPPQKNEAF
jgi:hypothetical protein